MNWYKQSQFNYAYHGTSVEFLPDIQKGGLVPALGELFFSTNEDDISSYADGLYLRFPMPLSYAKRIGRGDYYTTEDAIPPGQIEFKIGPYDTYKPLAAR